MIKQTVKMLQDAVGAIQEACYVVIDDIPEFMGYNGETQAARGTCSLKVLMSQSHTYGVISPYRE